jgi:predicted GNAT family acetyltransferase
LLDSGKEVCSLYADANSPAPNAVYQRIGYRQVCDWQMRHFTRE